MDAVGDVADGHLVDRAIGPQGGPHLARDLAVAAADAVARAARVQGELRHAEGLAVVVGARAPEPDDGVEVDADLAGQRAQRVDDQLGLVGVVARGHRGVRGEHGARAGRVQRVLQRRAARQLGAGQLQRGEGGVALVEVHHRRVDAHRPQRAHAAHAEQQVLGEAQVARAGVQARADPACHRAVLRAVGVEQEERHAPDVEAPDLRDDVLGADGDGDRDRLAPVAGDEGHRLALGIGRHPRLVLPAGGVDALAEVALAVEQADGDQRQRPVGGLLEDVAGQRPEAAGVDRQRGVDAVLGAEEAHRALGGGRAGRLGGPRHVGADALLQRPGALDEALVGGGALQRVGCHLGQQPDRVLAAQLPALRIDGAKGVGTAGRPRPAQVVGGPRQRVQRRGHARGKGLRGAVDVLASGQHGRA